MYLMSKQDSSTGRFKKYRTNRFRAQGPRFLNNPPLSYCHTIKGHCVFFTRPHILHRNGFWVVFGTEPAPKSDK